jgi:hypothetical protein
LCGSSTRSAQGKWGAGGVGGGGDLLLSYIYTINYYTYIIIYCICLHAAPYMCKKLVREMARRGSHGSCDFLFHLFFFFFFSETCHELVGDQEKGERNGEEGEEAMCEEEEVGEVVEVALAVLGLDAHRLHSKKKKEETKS